jgi:hypothetical protein
MTTKLTTEQILHAGVPLTDVLAAKMQVAVDFSTTYDPPAISSLSYLTQAFTVSGALAGDFVDCSFSQPLSGCILSGQVTATNQVTITIFNPTVSSVNLSSGTLKLRLTRSA